VAAARKIGVDRLRQGRVEFWEVRLGDALAAYDALKEPGDG